MRRGGTRCGMTGTIVTLMGLAVAACGQAIPGSAMAPPGDSSSVAIPAGLDIGEEKVTGYVPPQGDPDRAWIAEGNRMLEALVLPAEVEPALTFPVEGIESVPVIDWTGFTGPNDRSVLIDGAKVAVMVARADRETGSTREVRAGMYRFESDKDVESAEKSIGYEWEKHRSVAVAGANDAKSVELVAGTVESVVRVGPIILLVRARAADSAAALKLAEAALARQLPLARAFVPTAQARITALPLDRGGMLARTMGSEHPGKRDIRAIGVLTLSMLERRLLNPTVLVDYRTAGVDLVGWNVSVVARARDREAAKGFARAWSAASGNTPAAGVPVLGDAVSCAKSVSLNGFACFVVVDRYVARVLGDDLTTAHQRAAAQWLILKEAK
ncbi:hypothetical protein GCM10009648_02750 [Tsukamurella spumae]